MRYGTPIRRAQLVSPFGVGAMTTGPDGISVMTAGLDAWFRHEGGQTDSSGIDMAEFRVDEWRLQRYLRVKELRLPPDFRTRRAFVGAPTTNTALTVPMVRFPQMHFCRNGKCLSLHRLPLNTRGRVKCSHCDNGWLVQVPYIAICAAGHAQDFPFREWVHQSPTVSCTQTMKMRSTGGASLAAQVIECECGASRTLASITEGSADRSFLSSNLSRGEHYGCPGHTPWHGTEQANGCGLPIKGSLRSASNVYYAVTRSSIYLPQSEDPAIESILEMFTSHSGLRQLLELLEGSNHQNPISAMRNTARADLEEWDDDKINQALAIRNSDRDNASLEDESEANEAEADFRRAEFDTLVAPQRHKELESRTLPIEDYGDWIVQHFDRIVLVERLRETRAMVGFERIVPETPLHIEERKRQLRKQRGGVAASWLPATLVYGEGIFLVLREDRLALWEKRGDVQERAARLQANFGQAVELRGLRDRDLHSRLPMIHTLAHLVMNRLTFECGYSSASLRERLYVSHGPKPMAGLLIYTAAGDSEGTMGGLVRMGRPQHFSRIVLSALEDAVWCSADPVCMEIGSMGGQGPDSCNLAACHNCALVPETACEQFNRFLDRGLVVGSHENQSLGYFDLKA